LLLGAGQDGGTRTPTAEEVMELKVKRTLNEMESAYESLRTRELMDLLHRRYDDWLGFKSALEDLHRDTSQVDLLMVLDSVLVEGQRAVAKLHWFRRITGRDGTEARTEGNSEFIFRKTPEGLKLIRIHDDNPFL